MLTSKMSRGDYDNFIASRSAPTRNPARPAPPMVGKGPRERKHDQTLSPSMPPFPDVRPWLTAYMQLSALRRPRGGSSVRPRRGGRPGLRGGRGKSGKQGELKRPGRRAWSRQRRR